MNNKEKQLIQKQFDTWANDPVAFIEFFWPKSIVWDKLEEICLSVRDNRGTVVPSGHGIGKSWISARIALWWLFTRYPSKVVTTAPTFTQVQGVLWGEIRSALAKAKVPLCDPKDILQTEIKLSPDWFAIGFSTTERVEQREYGSTKMQGFHSPYLLVIKDEAPGVDHSIHVATDSLTTGQNNRSLDIGNPTSPTGDFYDHCYSKNWHKIQVSCYDHPNVKEGKEVVPGAVTRDWIERMKEEWGENSPLFKAKVLGEFPDETEDTLIPLSWCEKAVLAEVSTEGRTVLGVDPARFGDDKTIAMELRQNVAKIIYELTKEDTMAVTGKLALVKDQYEIFGIDGTGIGSGVIDRLREVLDSPMEESERIGYKVQEIHFGSSPTDSNKPRFRMLRDEMYWMLRERLRPDAPIEKRIRIPNDPQLINQLSSIKIEYTSDGRMQIESKDKMKSRGLKSPDKADALALAVWVGQPLFSVRRPLEEKYKEFYEYKKQMSAGYSFIDRL